MVLHDGDIEEFRKIYHEEYNELLSPDEAREIAARLLQLYELLARPLPSEQARNLENPLQGAILSEDDRGPPGASALSRQGLRHNTLATPP